jgi:hypothetical protein
MTTPELVSGKLYKELDLPKGAEILTIEIQNKDNVCLWAAVNPEEEQNETRRFVLFGTGMGIPDSLELKYIKTILISEGVFVYHGFEILNKEVI